MTSLLRGRETRVHSLTELLTLYILLYADDTIIFAESDSELQAALNAMYLYCITWDIEVNPANTKIAIFSNRKTQQNPIIPKMFRSWKLMIILYI